MNTLGILVNCTMNYLGFRNSPFLCSLVSSSLLNHLSLTTGLRSRPQSPSVILASACLGIT